jgi:hypothetical protein
MDEAFLRERAQHIRNLAEKADPFIKKRLLKLAANYEKRIRQHSSATAKLLPKPPSEQK